MGTPQLYYSPPVQNLSTLIIGNPEAWGYKSLARDRNVYEPLDASPDETFELHLIGEGQLEIPRALSKAVFIHRGLNYTDFYALMQQMDIVIPAFVNVDCESDLKKKEWVLTTLH